MRFHDNNRHTGRQFDSNCQIVFRRKHLLSLSWLATVSIATMRDTTIHIIKMLHECDSFATQNAYKRIYLIEFKNRHKLVVKRQYSIRCMHFLVRDVWRRTHWPLCLAVPSVCVCCAAKVIWRMSLKGISPSYIQWFFWFVFSIRFLFEQK